MAIIETVLRQKLVDAGTAAEWRVFPLLLPTRPEYPALTYQMISNQGHHDLPIDFPRVSITAWAETLIEARELAEEVQAELQCYKGVLDGHRIKQIIKEPGPGVLLDREAGSAGVYYVPVDYRVIYER